MPGGLIILDLSDSFAVEQEYFCVKRIHPFLHTGTAASPVRGGDIHVAHLSLGRRCTSTSCLTLRAWLQQDGWAALAPP